MMAKGSECCRIGMGRKRAHPKNVNIDDSGTASLRQQDHLILSQEENMKYRESCKEKIKWRA